MLSKEITPAQEGVNRRFFEAVEELKVLGRLRSLSGFCADSGLSAPRYRELRAKFGVSPVPDAACRYTYVEADALVALVTKYRVSPGWLLTGRGKMLRK
jgi:hypothetical protein